jgi:transposase
MRGKKSEEHFQAEDPPRYRARKQRGRGTYTNDCPPVWGIWGRETGQIRLRVVKDTKSATLCEQVHRFSQPQAIVYTDDCPSYERLQRERVIVTHSTKRYAEDEDGDGWFETHTNSCEGLWSGLRTFLRPFRGVHKRLLADYVAIYEHRVNLKVISPDFIAAFVTWHYFWT